MRKRNDGKKRGIVPALREGQFWRLRQRYSALAWGMLLCGLTLTVASLSVLLWACRSGRLSPALQAIHMRPCLDSVAAALLLTVGGSLLLNYADKRDP